MHGLGLVFSALPLTGLSKISLLMYTFSVRSVKPLSSGVVFDSV